MSTGDSGDYVYAYVGADGTTLNGRFPKDRDCFWIWSASQQTNPDGVPDSASDWSFGREFRWSSGTFGDSGAYYVRDGLTQALDWQTRRLGVNGYFLDDTKGTNAGFVQYLLNQRAMADKFAFGEYSDGQSGNVVGWMDSIDRRCAALDFPLRYMLRNVCNNVGRADMRQILAEGVIWQDPANAVTFVEDADIDLSDPIIWNKLLAYAAILTLPGYPMLFGKDLYPVAAGGYGLLDPVLTLVWIHETFARGDIRWRATAYDYLVHERMGDETSSGCLVGLCNRGGDIANPAAWTPVQVQCKWANTRLHDYTGRSQDQWSDASGQVTLWLPPNDNGRGYVVFAPAGVENRIALTPFPTTQTFFGADDLDTPAAVNGGTALGTITLAAGATPATRVHPTASIPGAIWHVGCFDSDGISITGAASRTGPCQVILSCAGLPSDSHAPFEATVTYTAPRLPVVSG